MFSVSKTNLSKFAVVYPKYNTSYMVMHELMKLAKELARVTGKAPALLDDASCTRKYTITAAVDDTLARDAWAITPSDCKLTLRGGRPWALCTAIAKLRSLIRAGKPFDAVSGVYKPASARSMALTWHDDFDGDSVNPAYWDVFDGDRGRSPGKRGLTSYRRAANTYTKDSKLHIAATHDENGWYGGMMRSWNLVMWKYGYVEISAKIPDGKGFWTAFWMCSGTGDVLNQEIDVYECAGDAHRIAGNVHRWPTAKGKEQGLTHTSLDGGNYSGRRITLADGSSFGDEFHTYGYAWDEEKVIFTCDGREYFRYRINEKEADIAACHNPMYFILSQAVAFANPFTGEPDETNDWENKNKLIVDYIALWQKPGQELILGC